jgi:carbamate kinase
MKKKKKTAVVALGGNAITREGERDTIPRQFANTRESLSGIVELIKDSYNLAITHGNGPQVGNAVLRVELAKGKATYLPLQICVADTEGGIGYMIEQCLENRLKDEKIKRDVVTIVTQAVVDKEDLSIKNPTKFIGQFYSKKQAREFTEERDWVMKEDSRRGWRRVVPSPVPLEIVEKKTIKNLVNKGTIVIAAGGGGVPVYREDGELNGLDAVIDKDRASAVLARNIGAELLLILTGGHFPPGSMGPKIEAAIQFLESGGKEVIITSVKKAYQSVKKKAGTRIVHG